VLDQRDLCPFPVSNRSIRTRQRSQRSQGAEGLGRGDRRPLRPARRAHRGHRLFKRLGADAGRAGDTQGRRPRGIDSLRRAAAGDAHRGALKGRPHNDDMAGLCMVLWDCRFAGGLPGDRSLRVDLRVKTLDPVYSHLENLHEACARDNPIGRSINGASTTTATNGRRRFRDGANDVAPLSHGVARLVPLHPLASPQLTPWEPGRIDDYCHACKRRWLARC
jgi:hypothetical protein